MGESSRWQAGLAHCACGKLNVMIIDWCEGAQFTQTNAEVDLDILLSPNIACLDGTHAVCRGRWSNTD